MIAMASEDGICVLEFLNGRRMSSAARKFAARFGAPFVAGSNGHVERLRRELDGYFRGELRRFETRLDLRGTPFQRAVWRRLARVRYGATLTYTQLAARAGRKSAVRAAGHANGRNPVSIVVPCHRVVGTDGTLRGYGGGMWRKEWLINFEGAARRRDQRGEPPRRPQLRGSLVSRG
jgi:AraC family transcriptional regulator, regulatory protein of adaptative response / methylated-DNA-[protein]-cysteine methyltransferase